MRKKLLLPPFFSSSGVQLDCQVCRWPRPKEAHGYPIGRKEKQSKVGFILRQSEVELIWQDN